MVSWLKDYFFSGVLRSVACVAMVESFVFISGLLWFIESSGLIVTILATSRIVVATYAVCRIRRFIESTTRGNPVIIFSTLCYRCKRRMINTSIMASNALGYVFVLPVVLLENCVFRTLRLKIPDIYIGMVVACSIQVGVSRVEKLSFINFGDGCSLE